MKFHWDGSTIAIDGSSGNVNFTQNGEAVTRSISDKLHDIVSILDFGTDKTGVTLCNVALDAAKAVCNTIYFPPGVYRIEGYNLQDLRIVGAGTDGANYGVFTTIIEGSGDIFVNLEHLTIRNSITGVLGKLISIKDIDTSIGPISHCNFLRANYHIYSNSSISTIVGSRLYKCLFREAVICSRYYMNAGLNSYSELSCYTQANNQGLFIQNTAGVLIGDGVFEYQNESAIIIQNTTNYTECIRDLKIQNIMFEHNGNITPSADITINITHSSAKIEFDNCGFYLSTLAGNVDLTNSPLLRIFDHHCANISYDNITSGTIITSINPKQVGRSNGLFINGGDIETNGAFISRNGFTAAQSISTTIYNNNTPTQIALPDAHSTRLVIVCDSTSGGAALLQLTNTNVITISTTITSVTWSVSNGFLYGMTTGGSSFRLMFFNFMST